MTDSYEYEAAVDAVLKFGADQWYLIGNKLRMTHAPIIAATHEMPTLAGKLQTTISVKRNELGGQEVIKQLLEACRKLPQPILGIVKQHLDFHPSGRWATGEVASSTTGIRSLN
jgi:Mrp family chromosome partitioning ATPase